MGKLDHLIDATEFDVFVLKSNWYTSPGAKYCVIKAPPPLQRVVARNGRATPSTPQCLPHVYYDLV